MKKINFIDLQRQYLNIKNEINASVLGVIEQGNFIQGDQVRQLEDELGKYVGSNSVTVANGTDALFISLMALGIKKGDEVITPSFTWVSTVEAIKLVGATPKFIDIEEDTFNINPELISESINEKTKLILAVSLFGRCPNLDKIMKIAKDYDLLVLEDAAQSFGARSNNQNSCSIADISTTSFFPAKPLGCYGDGGAIFSNNHDLLDSANIISKHGQRGRYNYLKVGVNSRLDTIQAAVLLEKLKIFESEIDKRNKVASQYNSHFSRFELIGAPIIPELANRSVWAQYTVLLDKSICDQRDRIMAIMKEKNIPTALYYPALLHEQGPYRDEPVLPISSEVAKRVISLPMHPYLEVDEVEFIAENFKETLLKL